MRWLTTPVGRVAVVGPGWSWADRLGAWAVRWTIGRETYAVAPGLYAVGEPDADAPVVVTANYKLTFDVVRRDLAGVNAWLLVLETHGINVWCAAGKGTFGTDELVARLEATRLGEVVRHRELFLPIFGATGVSAAAVKRRTGFLPRFVALRSADLPRFVATRVTEPAMRELSFTLAERLVLAPAELVPALRSALPALLVVLAAAFVWSGNPFVALAAGATLVGAVACGAVVSPALLPWLPGRSFAFKGAIVGLLYVAGLWALAGGEWSPAVGLAHLFLLVPVVSFLSLTFTGSTPFTSRSGVLRELRVAIPAQLGSLALGLAAAALALWGGW